MSELQKDLLTTAIIILISAGTVFLMIAGGMYFGPLGAAVVAFVAAGICYAIYRRAAP